MKNKLTEIVIVLDRSYSMKELIDEVIGGINQFIEKQKLEKGIANLTLVIFDDKYETIYENKNIKEVKPITKKIFFERGTTALLDAVGKTITTLKNKLDDFKKKELSNVIFVIFTDGLENASVEYTKTQVKQLIEDNKQWEFLFLGANIDSFSEAGAVGINMKTTSNYSATSKGMSTAMRAVNQAVSSYRTDGVILDNWSKDIE